MISHNKMIVVLSIMVIILSVVLGMVIEDIRELKKRVDNMEIGLDTHLFESGVLEADINSK